jgi:signal peptidase I
MSELSLNLDPKHSPLGGSPFEAPKSKPSGWRRPIIAFLLTFLAAGLGQLYNRQIWKAVSFALIGPGISLSAAYAGAFHGFGSLLAIISFAIVWTFTAATDAFVTGRKQSNLGVPAWDFEPVWRVSAFLLVIAPAGVAGVASQGYFLDHIARARAFRVPSASNCPTVCEGERMIVDPSAYAAHAPQRGDLVMFKQKNFDSLLFKRVVAIGGDVVTGSPNSILVNGKPAALVDFSQICGDPPKPDRTYFPTGSRTVTVPPDSLYVVGDNWSNSFDSRTKEFGFVSLGEVRGRPLFLYWSPYKNRIGCRLR